MRVTAKRIEKIQVACSPAQAVYLHMEEATRFPSMDGFARWQMQPGNTEQVQKRWKSVGEDIERSLKKAKWDSQSIWQAKHLAGREISFLLQLFHNVNIKVYEEEKETHLTISLLAFQAIAVETMPNTEDLAMTWRTLLSQTLTRVYLKRTGIEQLSRQYYGGRRILFPDAARKLDQAIQYLEALVASKAKLDGKPPVDLQRLQEQAQEHWIAWAGPIVTMSKAEALRSIGEEKQADEIIRASF